MVELPGFVLGGTGCRACRVRRRGPHRADAPSRSTASDAAERSTARSRRSSVAGVEQGASSSAIGSPRAAAEGVVGRERELTVVAETAGPRHRAGRGLRLRAGRDRQVGDRSRRGRRDVGHRVCSSRRPALRADAVGVPAGRWPPARAPWPDAWPSCRAAVATAIGRADVGVLVVDSYERLNLLDGWLRNDFLPALPPA